MQLPRSNSDDFKILNLNIYGEYNKTEPTYPQYYCLFIFFVRLLPDMFRQVSLPLSRGLYQII
jgi:hypothetical protein